VRTNPKNCLLICKKINNAVIFDIKCATSRPPIRTVKGARRRVSESESVSKEERRKKRDFQTKHDSKLNHSSHHNIITTVARLPNIGAVAGDTTINNAKPTVPEHDENGSDYDSNEITVSNKQANSRSTRSLPDWQKKLMVKRHQEGRTTNSNKTRRCSAPRSTRKGPAALEFWIAKENK